MTRGGEAPFVRLAVLEIAAGHVETFNAALRKQVSEAVRIEPGVLALYAVALKDRPGHVRVFEVYADETAYKKHLDTPHFKLFRAQTDALVVSRTLFDTVPIVLGTKES